MSTAALLPLPVGLAVPGPEPTRTVRQAALAQLRAVGWPTRRREQWRYTDLEPLATAGFELTPGPTGDDTRAAVRRLLAEPAFGDPSRQLVLVDGRRINGIGATAIDILEVSAPEARWNDFEARFASAIPTTDHPLAALNTAFTEQGLWIRVPAGFAADAPIHLVIVSSTQSRVATQPRIVIDAEPGAQVTFVQHFVDCAGESSGWTNSVTQLKQARDSRIALYRFQRHGQDRVHTSLLSADLAAGAELTAGYFDLGGKLVRNDIAITLSGAHARADLFGLLLAGASQHIDDHTLIRHAAGATQSVENVRAIIGEHGRGVFNGKVVVDRDCQRIDARQNNDNLLLGEHAEIDAKPELEIYANDVKCSHGATVGELDAEQLFYLQARGLDTATARSLLTTAFAAVIVEQVLDETVRNQALAHVTARLRTLTER